jgi:hypothetical protein
VFPEMSKVPQLATYTFVPSGVIAISRGPNSTGTVSVTVLVFVLIAETLLPFTTYTIVPAGLTTILSGGAPKGTVAIKVLVFVLIT